MHHVKRKSDDEPLDCGAHNFRTAPVLAPLGISCALSGRHQPELRQHPLYTSSCF